MVLHASRAHPEYRHQVQPAISPSALQLLTRQPRCPWWNVRWVVRTFPAAAPPWRTFLQMQEGEIMYLTRRARGVKCARGDASNYGARQSVSQSDGSDSGMLHSEHIREWGWWIVVDSFYLYLLFIYSFFFFFFFAMVLLKGFPWVRGRLGHLKLDFRFFFSFFF